MKVSADSPSPVPTQASTGDSKGSESKPFAKVLKEKAEADAGDSSEKDYFSFPRAKKPAEQIAGRRRCSCPPVAACFNCCSSAVRSGAADRSPPAKRQLFRAWYTKSR